MTERLRITWARLVLPERGAIFGAGVLVAQSAQVEGVGTSGSVGAGVLEAQAAQVAGRGGRPVVQSMGIAWRAPEARIPALRVPSMSLRFSERVTMGITFSGCDLILVPSPVTPPWRTVLVNGTRRTTVRGTLDDCVRAAREAELAPGESAEVHSLVGDGVYDVRLRRFAGGALEAA